MRWWKTPKKGDVRIVSWFALRPVTIGGETRWLEWVAVRQSYYSGYDDDCWENVSFET